MVTKLFVPPLRAVMVSRDRLLRQLDASSECDLTLLCAPAGFGKTTLLSAWAAASARPIAWVSLEESDSDLTRFLTYVISSLQTVAPSIGGAWLEALRSAQPSAAEAVLASLVNELSRLPGELTLVLDDYHVVDSAVVDSALAFLLQHLPRQLHVIISSRQDPNLPLARLRARDRLTELRASDLRFTPAEAADFLSAVMGLDLSGDDIMALERRTEGWIAGLQLAALSLRDHDDPSTFISGFAGDHRFIADYLVGEVLERQPADVRAFLLQTALLDQMNGPLCDAVTGGAGSQSRLDALDRGNFFVVPLDDQRRWYRYHHLFAEMLRAYLTEEQPAEVPMLHRRASTWFEQQGNLVEAVRHSLAAGDVEHVAGLLEQSAQELLRTRQEGTLLAWLRALPDDIFRNRPVLSASYAGVLLACGQVDGVEARLDAAEHLLGPAELHPDRVVVDEATFRQLPGAIAMWRAGAALLRGDTAGTVAHAHRAREVAGPDDHLIRGGAAGLLGLTALGAGDLDDAYAKYTECIGQLRLENHVADILGCSITLADIRIVQGRLADAEVIYNDGLRLARPADGQVLRGAADMHVGLSEIHWERGELDEARQHLSRCDALGESLGLPQNAYRSRVARAHLLQAESDFEGAAELLAQAELLYDSDFSPQLRPVPARRARVAVCQGHLDGALRWVSECGISPHDDLTYLREFEHLTLARVLIAKHQRGDDPAALSQAIDLLGRLLLAAELGGRTHSVIEILVLQTGALWQGRPTEGAVAPLTRALLLAEMERVVQPFLELENDALITLLRAIAHEGSAPAHVARLLALTSSVRSVGSDTVAGGVLDPLSQRELDVLRLLRTDLTGPDIARELVVSLHTVRSHTKSIYGKLGVNTRRAAVRVSEERGLLLPLPRQPLR
jgi:LuxR family maltose regulon positive regulatory protein